MDTFIPSGEVCLQDTATFSCTRMGDILQWFYGDTRVISLEVSSPDGTRMLPLIRGIRFTVTLSKTDSSYASNLSFVATLATYDDMITCTGISETASATTLVAMDGK